MRDSEFLDLRSGILNRLQADLDPRLTYHNREHTEDVMAQAERIACEEPITDKRILLLIKTAALFHDTGFLYTYKEHEKRSCQILSETVKADWFNAAEIELMHGMILATKVPQSPHNLYEMILCDADLDYLGRDDFEPISNHLKEEFMAYGIIKSELDWDQLQVKFFESHTYFTSTSIQSRQPSKLQHLKILKQKLLNPKM